MARNFFKENGSMIKSDGTTVTLKLDTTDPHNVFHNLLVSTNLSGIYIDDPAGTVKDPNTIFIKESDANTNMFEALSTPEMYFTATDMAHIYLNIKVKVVASKTNHAGKSLLDLIDEADKRTNEL